MSATLQTATLERRTQKGWTWNAQRGPLRALGYAAMAIAGYALDLAGDRGSLVDQPFERHFRDAKALQIYEGTNQVQRVVIARHLIA